MKKKSGYHSGWHKNGARLQAECEERCHAQNNNGTADSTVANKRRESNMSGSLNRRHNGAEGVQSDQEWKEITTKDSFRQLKWNGSPGEGRNQQRTTSCMLHGLFVAELRQAARRNFKKFVTSRT